MLKLRVLTNRLSLTPTQTSTLPSHVCLSRTRLFQTDSSADGKNGSPTQQVPATQSTSTEPQTVSTKKAQKSTTKSSTKSVDNAQPGSEEVKEKKKTRADLLSHQLKELAKKRGSNILAVNPSLAPGTLSKRALKKMKRTVPEMKPPIESHTHFLKLLGRDCESHASHFKDWSHMFTSSSSDMKAMGIPIVTRKLILNFIHRYREHGVEPYYIHKPDKKVVKARTRRRVLKQKYMERNNLVKKKPVVLTDGSIIDVYQENLTAKFGKKDTSLLD